MRAGVPKQFELEPHCVLAKEVETPRQVCRCEVLDCRCHVV